MHFISQHGATWWSDHRAFHQSTQCHMVVRSCIPLINTVSHGDQIVHCTNHQCHKAIRSCTAPINSVTGRSDGALHQSTVSQGDQIVHCTNQQCHRAIRSCTAPINSVTGRSDGALHQSTVSQGDQTVHCTNQHSITRRSDGKLVRMGWWDGGGGWNSEPLRQFCSLFTYFRLS